MTMIKKLNRRAAAAHLTANGYPISHLTLQKMASVSTDGPEYVVFGRDALYDPDHLLEWAKQRAGKPRRSTSEIIGRPVRKTETTAAA